MEAVFPVAGGTLHKIARRKCEGNKHVSQVALTAQDVAVTSRTHRIEFWPCRALLLPLVAGASVEGEGVIEVDVVGAGGCSWAHVPTEAEQALENEAVTIILDTGADASCPGTASQQPPNPKPSTLEVPCGLY